jgi:hypothetical protein
MNNELDISPRKQQLKEEYERLQQVYSNLITKRDDLVLHEIPRLEALYMEAIGQLQYEELCLQYDIALLKFERDLLQAYINRGEEPDIKVVALQPGPNSLPSESNPEPEEITGVHPFEGIPKERVPATMNLDIYDEKFEVETIEAYTAAREAAKSDGILVGTSSGAAIYAATEIAKRPENEGKTIVAVLPDTGLRYLSTPLFS